MNRTVAIIKMVQRMANRMEKTKPTIPQIFPAFTKFWLAPKLPPGACLVTFPAKTMAKMAQISPVMKPAEKKMEQMEHETEK